MYCLVLCFCALFVCCCNMVVCCVQAVWAPPMGAGGVLPRCADCWTVCVHCRWTCNLSSKRLSQGTVASGQASHDCLQPSYSETPSLQGGAQRHDIMRDQLLERHRHCCICCCAAPSNKRVHAFVTQSHPPVDVKRQCRCHTVIPCTATRVAASWACKNLR